MAEWGQETGMVEAGTGGATEPITLTDPDGAVTRVAPWSSWTREQVRAPGGEPALVTRLDQGQLWFAAGRRRSPWHHEVHVGPAVVSTPRGRFQATAEPDGGATIVCLSGRTRVVAGLREPVLLGTDQSAAVSADGRTLVVMDRPAGERAVTLAGDGGEVSDMADDMGATAAAEADQSAGEGIAAAAGGAAVVAAGAGAARTRKGSGKKSGSGKKPPSGKKSAAAKRSGSGKKPPQQRDRSRFAWVPELVAVAALVALLVSAVVVFGKPDSGSDDVASGPAPTVSLPPVSTASSQPVTTATTPTTTAIPSTTATTVVSSTTLATTTRPPTIAAGAIAIGELVGCRRASGGVQVSVRVNHRQGPASRFQVTVELVDAQGQPFAQATGPTAVLQPGASVVTDVVVPVQGRVAGACDVVSVVPG